MAGEVKENNVDLGSAAADFAAATAIGVAAKGLEMAKAKATLYVRMLGENNDTTGATTNQDVAALKGLIKTRKKKGKKAAQRAGAEVTEEEIVEEGVEIALSEAELAMEMLAIGFIPVPVQYNPTTLSMQTMGGTIEKYTAMGNESPNSLVSHDKKTSTYLTVELIFEQINNMDAFGSAAMDDPMGAVNISNTVDMAEDMVLNSLGGASVRTQVEGLISLLMLKRTRQIIFVWGNMFFHGELLSVDARFTMFNKIGNPIKAVASIQIQQTNGNATFKSDMEYWNEVLDEVFT
ncbi:MAG: hypothetical protein IKR23_08080 [Lachnospiraceae bacterium]|nr:hypothetical protein [Lachnospiraceae bacterium]